MNLQEMINEKREWRGHVKRVNKLPKEYQIVYKEIQNYLFKVGPVNLRKNDFGILYELVDLFEISANEGKHVLAITGKDVARFADELIGDTPTYMDGVMEESNQKVSKSIKKWIKK